MTLLGLLAGLGGLMLLGFVAWICWCVIALSQPDEEACSCDCEECELDLPTWSEAQEVAADKSYYDALREWQQSVELPMARPLSRSGVQRLRRDLRKPVKLTQAEAEHVREILFPKSRRAGKVS